MVAALWSCLVRVQNPGLVIPFDHSETFDCPALLEATYLEGMKHLET